MLQEPQLAAIALGTNLGSRERNLQQALHHLATLGTVEATSTFHDTPPELYLQQPRFLNAATLLRTTLSPLELLAELLQIEQTMGRQRTGVPPKGPRLIDLDLLLYSSEVLTTESLILPHPALHQRRFVLAPLAEIAPGWPHPLLHQTLGELLDQLDQAPPQLSHHPDKQE